MRATIDDGRGPIGICGLCGARRIRFAGATCNDALGDCSRYCKAMPSVMT